MPNTLRQLWSDQTNEIVNRFVAALKSNDPASSQLPRSLLIDHIPVFLGEIAEELESPRSARFARDINDSRETAPAHGKQRWDLGYDLSGLVREYGILRRAIMESANAQNVQLANEEFDLLGKCLNVGVADAAAEYSRHRDAELTTYNENLEFLAQAGELLAPSS